ncbi:hypothetical protein SAMN05444487_102235 [Marininema mesophilum]|uniref:Uncharacterized protein n=1 Tax=Marininema mesophilum TaxID=1048340 RepID=A0A1H2SJG5_9BACL|nr:hypothetical protein SAMN05444487_102235 [Marininema mesophilum]
MYQAFPGSDYYESSVAILGFQTFSHSHSGLPNLGDPHLASIEHAHNGFGCDVRPYPLIEGVSCVEPCQWLNHVTIDTTRRNVCYHLPLRATLFPLGLSFKQSSFHPCPLLLTSPLSRDLVVSRLGTFPACYFPPLVSLQGRLGGDRSCGLFDPPLANADFYRRLMGALERCPCLDQDGRDRHL